MRTAEQEALDEIRALLPELRKEGNKARGQERAALVGLVAAVKQVLSTFSGTAVSG